MGMSALPGVLIKADVGEYDCHVGVYAEGYVPLLILPIRAFQPADWLHSTTRLMIPSNILCL